MREDQWGEDYYFVRLQGVLGFKIGELEVAKEDRHVFLNVLPCQAIADVVGFLRVFRRVWGSKNILNLWCSCEKLSLGKIRF